MVILVLDDNPDIIMLVTTMINRAVSPGACEIITGRDGLEGLNLLGTKTPDLIISNLRMPNMDGFAFFKQVRLNTNWSEIPLVMMSAHHSPEVRQEASQNGAEFFISKPFGFADIQNTLRNFGIN